MRKRLDAKPTLSYSDIDSSSLFVHKSTEVARIAGRCIPAGVPVVLQEYTGTQVVARIALVHLRGHLKDAPRREGVLGHIRCSKTSAGVPGDLQEYAVAQLVERIVRVHLRESDLRESEKTGRLRECFLGHGVIGWVLVSGWALWSSSSPDGPWRAFWKVI